MRAVLPVTDPFDHPRPRLGDLPDPAAGPGEVLLAVRAAGLNRADLLQLRGLYPPPPGESEVPGLECAGVVETVGEEVAGWAPGDRAMALVAGGAHAERAAVPAGQLMPIPEGMSFVEAAAIPEAGLTAWTNLVAEGGLAAGEAVVISGANGGVGSFAVQLAHRLGARVIAAGRDRDRLAPLAGLGAAALVTLGDDLPEQVRAAAGGRGADLALDLVGGEHTPRLLAALAPRGRLVLVGVIAGPRAAIDLADLLRRRLRLVGSVLRSRPRPEKAGLVAAFADFALPRLADGRLRPVVDRVLPFERIDQAYAALAAGGVAGKVVVEMVAG
jgi:putative PIG3 family NAD(P)H quinone oxidoreductase